MNLIMRKYQILFSKSVQIIEEKTGKPEEAINGNQKTQNKNTTNLKRV